jgi:DNA end-binding protein Ku
VPDDDDTPQRPRSFWSGNIAFGLVSVPVHLFVATRPAGVSLRMVSEQGTPLSRRYFCSADDRPLGRDDIVRGYEVEKDRFVIVEDEELEALAPEKSQEIDLSRFVELSEIDPVYFERAYFLAPARGAVKAYRLLAKTMEETGRAGIATFVMRGKEYLIAIIAERGLLRAETLRFHDELRSPDDVGLPPLAPADAARVSAMNRAMDALAADKLNREALADRQSARLEELVQHKLETGTDVLATAAAEPEEPQGAEVVDLMQVLKQSLQEREERPAPARGATARQAPRAEPKATHKTRRRPARAGKTPALEKRSKNELYERARELDIPGRSGMSKEQLIAAIRRAG